MAGTNKVEYKQENTGELVSALSEVAAEAGSITAKKIETSQGDTSTKIGELEEKVVGINQQIGNVATNTAAMLECLSSSWTEFEEKIRRQWQG